jgi:DNA-binding MarR family transcriptional regulator
MSKKKNLQHDLKNYMYICIYNFCSNMDVEKTIKTEKRLSLQSKSVIHLLLVQNKINESAHIALKPFKVSLQQFNVLRILRGQKGTPANLSTINERMVTKMSNTSRLVDKLIAKELVGRVTCEKNRRKVEINITHNGLKALEKMDIAMLLSENELLKTFTEVELVQLNQLLNQF